MFGAQESSCYDDLTVEQARVIRVGQARLAALCADHVEQAQAAAQRGAMAHWTHEYRRSTMRCRLLGERIRREACDSVAVAADRDPTVVRLDPRPAADVPSTGEAA